MQNKSSLWVNSSVIGTLRYPWPTTQQAFVTKTSQDFQAHCGGGSIPRFRTQTSLNIFHLLVVHSQQIMWEGGVPISQAGGQTSHTLPGCPTFWNNPFSYVAYQLQFEVSIITILKTKHTCINLIDTIKTLREMNI